MIPMVSPRFIGVESSAASLRVTGGGVQHILGGATNMAYRGLDILSTTKGMPTWMASPLVVLKTSKRKVSMNASKLPGLGGTGLPLNSSKTTATGVSDGLLVRGGAEAVTAAPLGAALFTTACLSAVLERRTKAGAVVGAPLLSFGTFCIISNLSLVPVTHPVYDLCWSLLLPLSLSIIILGNPVVATREEQLSKLATRGESRIARSIFRVSAGPVGRVGMAFLVGAVGSVAGVAASFYVVTTYAGGAFALSREAAAKIAGAVTATYVGGSVNLFAVASAVGLVGATSAGGASLLGALAAADIFLMSVYFSFLVAVHKTVVDSSSLVSEPLQGKSGLNQPGAGAATRRGWRGSFRSSTRNTLALTAIGSTICLFGNAVTDSSPLPGTSTMVITLLTVGATRLLTRFAPGFQASLSRTAPIVATVLLNAFFGSVGASGRLAEVVGVAPAIFVFTSVALAVHIAVMATGAAILNRCCGAGLGVDDLIVASNANIGGPSTAATFAGLLGKDELVVPAAVWGTVGYAIATTLGVGVWVTLR